MSGKKSRRRRESHGARPDGGKQDPAQPPTLRQAVVQVADEQAGGDVDGAIQEAAAPVVEAIRNTAPVEASTAFRWFWEEAPDDESFSIGDFPPLLPRWANDPSGGAEHVLIEAKAPRRGLGWGSAVCSGATGENVLAGSVPATTATEVLKRAADSGAGAEIHGQALVSGPGMVRRAGALMSYNSDYRPSWAREWLAQTSASGVHKEISGVLSIVPCALLSGAVPVADISAAAHMLPLDGAGRPVVGDRDELPAAITDVRMEDGEDGEHESWVSTLMAAQRPVVLSALFALAALAESSREGGRCRSTAGPPDACGPTSTLSISALKPRLAAAARRSSLAASMEVLDGGAR